ncbi:twin-arginine translocase TatA/TatE family subunit [Bartonella doshiae]|uniref:twin-arginine translocase TatA/TatE family subunit n=1 Tax=Bartonella doshiae TaxID=33044 RepID=UPI000944DC18|nr:twin-arginine translocase TatA/TatE family subunit [Bartonella doshiae]
MGNIFSPTHLIIILLVILVLFGRGKVSELMGDIAKGIKAFKKNIKEEEESAEDKFEMSHTSKAINVESKQSYPQSTKYVAADRKVPSSTKRSKTSVTKKQHIK